MPQLRYFQPAQKQSMVKLLCGKKMKDKVIYSRHIFYTDYSNLGCEVMYFNMVGGRVWGDMIIKPTLPLQMRDPVERFISRYNFNRELLEIAKSDNILMQ